MKYKIFAIDLDGTLVAPSGIVARKDIAAVRLLKNDGVMILPCTGRSLTEATPILDEIDHCGYCVFVDGAHLYDKAQATTLHRAFVDTAIVSAFIGALADEPHPILALLDRSTCDIDYCVIGEKWLPSSAIKWLDSLGVCRTNQLDYLRGGVLRIGLLTTPECVDAVKERLRAKLDWAVVQRMLVQSLPAGNGHIKTLEVLPSGTDKWTSICRLSKSLGIAAQDVVAIGDSNNDVSMVGNAGCGIAMGNACDAVRQAAIHSTLSNGSGGFAMAVEKVMAGAW